MKFKFRPSNAKRRLPHANSKRKELRIKGATTLRVKKFKELSRNYAAEDFGRFDEDKKSSRFRVFTERIKEFFKFFNERFYRIKKKRKERRAIPCAALGGILCSAILICFLSASVVVASVFLRYNGPHTSVTVPNLISLDAKEATEVESDIFEYVIVYRSNPEQPSGVVTAQSPLPDVTRKFYGSNEKIKITLTVNSEQESFTLPRLKGTPLRDALILLKGKGINVNVVKEYSSTVDAGDIINCSVNEGTKLKSGDSLTLRASLGKEKLFFPVPDLSGLNENEAIAKIDSKGFSVGDVTYVNSKEPIGTVIAQSIAPNTPTSERTKISFTVSGGIHYES